MDNASNTGSNAEQQPEDFAMLALNQNQGGMQPLNSAGAAAMGNMGQGGGMGPQGGTKSNRVCRHFIRGRCTWGNQCRFSHDVSAAAAQQMAAQEAYEKGMGYGMQGGMGQGGMGQGGMGQGGMRGGMQGNMSANNMQGSMTNMGQARGGMGFNGADQRAVLGTQQQTLQSQRHAILIAAVQARFQIRAANGSGSVANDGQHMQRGQVILTGIVSAPEIVIQIFNEEQVQQTLEQLEQDDRVRDGGLHYLIGEGSVFWSMMRLWHVNGTTTSAKWDAVLERAARTGHVDCMFFKTNVGCLAPNCSFDHDPSGFEQQGQQQAQQSPPQQPTNQSFGEGEQPVVASTGSKLSAPAKEGEEGQPPQGTAWSENNSTAIW